VEFPRMDRSRGGRNFPHILPERFGFDSAFHDIRSCERSRQSSAYFSSSSVGRDFVELPGYLLNLAPQCVALPKGGRRKVRARTRLDCRASVSAPKAFGVHRNALQFYCSANLLLHYSVAIGC
jgi:hypothetical protein